MSKPKFHHTESADGVADTFTPDTTTGDDPLAPEPSFVDPADRPIDNSDLDAFRGLADHAEREARDPRAILTEMGPEERAKARAEMVAALKHLDEIERHEGPPSVGDRVTVREYEKGTLRREVLCTVFAVKPEGVIDADDPTTHELRNNVPRATTDKPTDGRFWSPRS